MADSTRGSLSSPFTIGVALDSNKPIPQIGGSIPRAENKEALVGSIYDQHREAPLGEAPKSTIQEAGEAYVKPEEYTKSESFWAAAFNISGQYQDAITSDLRYELDPNYNPNKMILELSQKIGVLTQQEIQVLSSSKNQEDAVFKVQNLMRNRKKEEIRQANPKSAIAGSFLEADALLMGVPVISVFGKASTLAKLSNRVTDAGVAGALIADYQYDTGDNLNRSKNERYLDTALISLVRGLAPSTKGALKELTTAPEVLNPALAEARAATKVAEEKAIQRAMDEDLVVANSVGRTDQQIADLTMPSQRGQARQARAEQRREAVAEVEQKYINLAAEKEAAKLLEDATEVEINEVAQKLLTEIEDIATNPPVGSPANQVSKNAMVAQLQSTWDYLNYITRGDAATVVNKLLSNPANGMGGDDAISLINVLNNNYQSRIMVIEDGFKDAVAKTGVRSNFITRRSGAYAKATNEVGADFQEAMMKIDAEVLAYHEAMGVLPDAAALESSILRNTDKPHIQELVRKYIDSGLSEQVHKDFSGVGIITKEVDDGVGGFKTVDGAEDILRRPTYLNLNHNYDAMAATVRSGKGTWDDIADFIGVQIGRQYPDLLNAKNAKGTFYLTERQLGQHFIQTQREVAQGLSTVTSTGMNKEQLTTLLSRSGKLTEKESRSVAESMYAEMHKKGTATPKSLRRRIGWDWNSKHRTESGQVISMRDVVDNNVLGNLEDYSRGMAHRVGMAHYGIKSESDLHNLLRGYLDNLPEDVDPQKARQFMKDTANTMFGKPIDSNPVPQGVRSAQALADLFLLANSGLYTMVDIVSQVLKVGALRSFPEFKRGFGTMFKDLKHFSPVEAKGIEDILTGRILATSRHRNFTTRYSDNFAVGKGIHEAAQYYGQTARFTNLSESLKRFQVGVLAGVYTTNLKGAMKGSARELEYMTKKLGIDDDLIKQIQGEYAKHGTNIDDWSNGVRIKYEQRLFHDADNFAMNIHSGEVPAILEYSTVGRVIFPYMRFAVGMQNKVLRRTLEREGNAGLAMLLAVQIPTAMLIAAAINVRLGKEPDENLLSGTLRSMTATGVFNYPADLFLNGFEGQGSATAFVPFLKSYNLAKEVVTGGGTDGAITADEAYRNSPVYSNVIVGYVVAAARELNDEGGSK